MVTYFYYLYLDSDDPNLRLELSEFVYLHKCKVVVPDQDLIEINIPGSSTKYAGRSTPPTIQIAGDQVNILFLLKFSNIAHLYEQRYEYDYSISGRTLNHSDRGMWRDDPGDL